MLAPGGTITAVAVTHGSTPSSNNYVAHGGTFRLTVDGTDLGGVTEVRLADSTGTVVTNTTTQVVIDVRVRGPRTGFATLELIQGNRLATGGEFAVTVQPSTISTSGDDTNGFGTLAAPFATITRGLQGLESGDIAQALDGSYSVPAGLTLAPGVTLMGTSPRMGSSGTELVGPGTGDIVGVSLGGGGGLKDISVRGYARSVVVTGGGNNVVENTNLHSSVWGVDVGSSFTGSLTVANSLIEFTDTAGTCTDCGGVRHVGSAGNVTLNTVDVLPSDSNGNRSITDEPGSFYGLLTRGSTGTFTFSGIQGLGLFTARGPCVAVEGAGGQVSLSGMVISGCTDAGVLVASDVPTSRVVQINASAVTSAEDGFRFLGGNVQMTGRMVANLSRGCGIRASGAGSVALTSNNSVIGNTGVSTTGTPIAAGVCTTTDFTGTLNLVGASITGTGGATLTAGALILGAGSVTLVVAPSGNAGPGILLRGDASVVIGSDSFPTNMGANGGATVDIESGGSQPVTVKNVNFRGDFNGGIGLRVAPQSTTNGKLVKVESSTFAELTKGIVVTGDQAVTVRLTRNNINFNNEDGVLVENPRAAMQLGEASSAAGEMGGFNTFGANSQAGFNACYMMGATDQCCVPGAWGDFRDARPVVSGFTAPRTTFFQNTWASVFGQSPLLPQDFTTGAVSGDRNGPTSIFPTQTGTGCLAAGETPGRHRILLETAAATARFDDAP